MDDFFNWIEELHDLAQAMTEDDKITAMIQAAGPGGVTESDLRKAIKLDRGILDKMLSAMLQIRLIGVRQDDNGERVFFSTCPVQLRT